MIKPGVRIDWLTPQLVLAAVAAYHIYDFYGEAFMITSGNDGKHMVGSLHYCGRALDIARPKTVDTAVILELLRETLGESYDILDELDHIHIEFDPKD